MHLLGILITVCGFIGVVGIGVLSTTGNLVAALITHAVLMAAFICWSITRSNGIRGWIQTRIDSTYGVPPAVIAGVGLLFVILGLCAALQIGVKPGEDADSITGAEQAYLGIVFACIGGGLIPIGARDMLDRRDTRQRK